MKSKMLGILMTIAAFGTSPQWHRWRRTTAMSYLT
jgi:hypothetical protein